MSNFNRKNCDSSVRATITDRYGQTIMLVGKHAFEWSIVIQFGRITKITTYPNRKIALKNFKLYKKKRE